MPAPENDTICAIATPPGRSGIGIIRISGPGVPQISRQLLGFSPQPRHAHYCDFLDAGSRTIDQGITVYYPSPHSFTGEDVLELQGHGGVHVLNELLEIITDLNVRIAAPGEFSERAFLNNKIDLLQAEAIADLIDASSRQAARSAVRTLQGEFSRRIHGLVEKLTTTRVNVEAAIDFSDEDIDIISTTDVCQSLNGILTELDGVFDRAQQGALLNEGMNVIIAGEPNAGKSSLLNALSETESAIVTDIPGTTRDLLREEIAIDGMPVHVTDTAGLRLSEDPVEQEGVKRAQAAIEKADRLLLLVDADKSARQPLDKLLQPLGSQDRSQDNHSTGDMMDKTTLIFNKIDLCEDSLPRLLSRTIPRSIHRESNESFEERELTCIYLSAKYGQGLDLLRRHLKDCIGCRSGEEGAFVARKRHLEALSKARESIEIAVSNVSNHSQIELVAEDLRLAQLSLGSITGEFTSDDLLGKIFAGFCIGK